MKEIQKIKAVEDEGEATLENAGPADDKVIKSRSTSTEVQIAKVLALLRQRAQSTYDLRKHGIAQCAARICQLRAFGHVIITEKVIAIDSDGFTHINVARYSLIKEALQQTDCGRHE